MQPGGPAIEGWSSGWLAPTGEGQGELELLFRVTRPAESLRPWLQRAPTGVDRLEAVEWLAAPWADDAGELQVRVDLDMRRISAVRFGVARLRASSETACAASMTMLAADPERLALRPLGAVGPTRWLAVEPWTHAGPAAGSAVGTAGPPKLYGPPLELGNSAISSEQARSLLQQVEVDEGGAEMAAVRRLLTQHQALLAMVGHAADDREGDAANVARYVVGVVLRVTELVGGRLGVVTEADVDAASDYVTRCLECDLPHPLGLTRTVRLLPFDREFPLRARAFPRPQPHLLDAVLEDPLERDPTTPWTIDPARRAWVYLQAWKALLAVDRRWQGPRSVHPSTSE